MSISLNQQLQQKSPHLATSTMRAKSAQTAEPSHFPFVAMHSTPLAQSLPLHFGVAFTQTLPPWTESIEKHPPKLTHPMLVERRKKEMEKIKGTKGFSFELMGVIVKELWGQFQIAQLQKKSKQYLPPEIKSRITRYQWTQGLFDRWFRKGEYQKNLIVLEGPMAIKAKQAEVEQLNETIASLKLFQAIAKQSTTKKEEENPSPNGTTPGVVNSPKKEKPPNKNKWIQDIAIALGKPLLSFGLGRAVKQKESQLALYKGLLNNVPLIDPAQFKGQLDTLQHEFNKVHPQDPLKTIGKPLKSGSVAQVFEAYTQSGKKLALKMARPDARPELLEQFKPYLYYINILNNGLASEAKRVAVDDAEATVNVMKEEVNLKQEANNVARMNDWMTRLSLTQFKLPQVYAATSNGVAYEFVGHTDFIDLSEAEQGQSKLKLIPDFAKLMLFSPIKPLDIHSGNVRQGDNITYLLDHGRQVNCDERVHEALVQLMGVLLLEGSYRPFLKKDIFEAFKTLVSSHGKSDASREAFLNAVEKLMDSTDITTRWSQYENNRDAYERELQNYRWDPDKDNKTEPQKPTELLKMEQDLQPLIRYEQMLKVLTREPKNYDETIKDRREGSLAQESTEENHKKKNDTDRYRPQTLFGIWANYLSLPHLFTEAKGFAPLLDHWVSPEDQGRALQKFLNFSKPYFTTPLTSDAEARLQTQLKSISPDQLCQSLMDDLDLVDYSLKKYLGTQLSEALKRLHDKLSDQKYYQDILILDPKADWATPLLKEVDKALPKERKQVQEALNQLIQENGQSFTSLVRLMSSAQRMNALITGIYEPIAARFNQPQKQSSSSTAKTALDNKQQQALRRTILQMIESDFKLTPSDYAGEEKQESAFLLF